MKHCIIEAFARKGSAEDECGDGVARFAKIRPMRVKMYGMNWNDDWGKITHAAIRTGKPYACPQQTETVPIHSRHCSGQRGDYLIEDDPRRPKNNRTSDRMNYKL